MFDVQEPRSQRSHTVYAVHKSGPLDEQTKFLLHVDGTWKWVWAVHYLPVQPSAPEAPFRPVPEEVGRSATGRILRGGKARTA